MGLLAGIYSEDLRSDLNSRLPKMIACQVHRDKMTPIVWFEEKCAIGMVNQHAAAFTSGYSNNNEQAPQQEQGIGEIHAFVDGIVLNVQQHASYFESKGGIVCPLDCSAIIGHAYAEWGMDFMNHLDGEFSCAVWDGKMQRLILARDVYGKKPLHYYYNGKELVFSSEIKGILKAGIVPDVDRISLSDFMSLNCIPYPATIFKDIYQVPPGSLLIFNGKCLSIQRYWYHDISVDSSITFDQAVYDLENAIRDSIRKRLIGEDIYCFLSGGIDSSTVVSYAAELSSRSVHAITVGFAEDEANELDDAAIMARHVGAIHHPVIASPDSFLQMLDELVFHHDSPFTDTSAYPSYFAAKLAHEFTDIILTGDGPDQIFSGSAHHVFAENHDIFTSRNWIVQFAMRFGASCAGCLTNDPTPTTFSRVQRKLYRESLSPVHAAYDLRSYFPDIVKRYMCSDDFWQIHVDNNPYRHPESWFSDAQGLDSVNQYLFADMRFYVPDNLMIKVDRMSMAHGLETLSPFLDKNVAAIANILPGNFKLRRGQQGPLLTKYILREICNKRLPKELLVKKKKGFGIPLGKWLRHDGGEFLKQVLLDTRTLSRGYFKKESIEKMIKVFLDNRGDYFFPSVNGLVSLLTLELWHRRYLDR